MRSSPIAPDESLKGGGEIQTERLTPTMPLPEKKVTLFSDGLGDQRREEVTLGAPVALST